MSTCCPPNSALPSLASGNVVIVPAGSTPVAIPQYACAGSEQSVGSASNPGSQSSSLITTFSYPTVKTTFTAPAVNANGSFFSANASQWAVVGAYVWISPVGHVRITGISGELVSFQNLSIPASTSVSAESRIIISAPPVPQSLQSGETVEEDTGLDFVRGLTSNVAKYLGGANGSILRRIGNKWQASPLLTLQLLATPVDLTPPNFQGISTDGSSTITGTLQLASAGLPSVLPATFGVLITTRMRTLYSGSTVGYGEVVSAGGEKLCATYGNDHSVNTSIMRCTSATPQVSWNRYFQRGSCNFIIQGFFI